MSRKTTIKPLPLFPLELDPEFNLDRLRAVRATGSPWFKTNDSPATVPMPVPVILADVIGDYTERDRKLFRFLVHAAFKTLEEGKNVHCLPIRDIANVFREFGGEHDSAWILKSARRLSRVEVEYKITCGDPRFDVSPDEAGEGFTRFLAGAKKTDSGNLVYEIPNQLVEIILKPYRFARLRTHFVIGLSGKYAVTLYEILESFANKDDPQFSVSLPELRQWLKVKPEQYPAWQDFKRWVLKPALDQINTEPEGAGFSVEMTPLKIGRDVCGLHFRLEKSKARAWTDDMQQKVAKEVRDLKSIADAPIISSKALDVVSNLYPSADVYQIRSDWVAFWAERGRKQLRSPNKAFMKFAEGWAKARKIPKAGWG